MVHFKNCCFRVIPRHCQNLSCPINTEAVSEELCLLRYVNTLLQNDERNCYYFHMLFRSYVPYLNKIWQNFVLFMMADVCCDNIV